MTDREIIQWLRDEAAYWRGGVDGGPDHPDGAGDDTIRMCEAAADCLEELAVAQ